MMENDNLRNSGKGLQIYFKEDSLVIRKVDNGGFLIKENTLDMNNLTLEESVFVDNIISMSTTLINSKNQEISCKCKNCGCGKKQ